MAARISVCGRYPLVVCLAALALPALGRAYYQPLDDVRSDGEQAALVVTTPYLPIGQGNCDIYPYNYYGDCAHPAWDIGSSNGGYWIENQPVRAVAAGTIAAIDPDQYCGLDVFVDHGNGVFTRYCHLNSFADIAVGQQVAARGVLGYLGGTYGFVPHLHFEARSGGISGAYFDLGDPLSWPTTVDNNQPPPSDPCNGLDYLGECQGSVLRWCENGAPQSYDCAAVGMVCGFQDAQIGNNCLVALAAPQQPADPCAGLDYAGVCEGSVLRWCENGAALSYDCAAVGMHCGFQDAQLGNNCLSGEGAQFAVDGCVDGAGCPLFQSPKASLKRPLVVGAGKLVDPPAAHQLAAATDAERGPERERIGFGNGCAAAGERAPLTALLIVCSALWRRRRAG